MSNRQTTMQAATRIQRNGTTTVEFALVCPILFMFILAAVEYARANQALNAVSNAAYQGCRAGIVPGATASTASAAAKVNLDTALLTGAVITVTPSNITNTTPEVTVNVSVPLAQNSWLIKLFFTNGTTINRTCTLTREKTN